MYTTIDRCRICGNASLVSILHLGEQYLSGVFPRHLSASISRGPLELVKCHAERGHEACGLLQLRQSYPPHELYGHNYGYRSGLNQAMVQHLHAKVQGILARVRLEPGDLVLDIGSNDSTMLQAYPPHITLVGIDPTGDKFRQFYPEHIALIPDFFSAETFTRHWPGKKAKVITSIAMFYDLEHPLTFMTDIKQVLAEDGLWVCEQSYMPTMLHRNAYDTICHEHLEYYQLTQIQWMAEHVGLKIVDVELNDVNGGSFSFVAMHRDAPNAWPSDYVSTLLHQEQSTFGDLRPYEAFRMRVFQHRDVLQDMVHRLHKEHKVVFGYGASTKGNTILQFCQFTAQDIPYIAEVNEDKFGCVTPGTWIPIIPEAEARQMHPDYFLVLPWHFKKGFVQKEQAYLQRGGKLLFPLPVVEVLV